MKINRSVEARGEGIELPMIPKAVTTEITRDLLRAIRGDFAEALKGIEEKYQINLNVGKISFTSTTFTAKIEGALKTVKSSTGETMNFTSIEAIQYFKYAGMYGLPPLNSKITLRGKEFIVVGFNPKATKNQVIIEGEAGRFVTSVNAVKRSV